MLLYYYFFLKIQWKHWQSVSMRNLIPCWQRSAGFWRFMRFHLGVITLAQPCPYAIFKPENKYCNHSQASIALVAFYWLQMRLCLKLFRGIEMFHLWLHHSTSWLCKQQDCREISEFFIYPTPPPHRTPPHPETEDFDAYAELWVNVLDGSTLLTVSVPNNI